MPRLREQRAPSVGGVDALAAVIVDDELHLPVAVEVEHRGRVRVAAVLVVEPEASAGFSAHEVCGAGGGGCLFCFGPPERREAIRVALSAGGARVLDFTLQRHGLTRG